jgi:hypothetical protein
MLWRGFCILQSEFYTKKIMSLKWQERPLPAQPSRKRLSLFLISFKFFPAGLLLKLIAFLLTMSPLIFNYLLDHYEIDSIVTRGLLTAAIIGGVPTIALYLITLIRAPSIRKRAEMESVRQQVDHKI